MSVANNKTQSHKDLLVWQESMRLVKSVYELCLLLPKDEIYGLSSQMKRAAVSVPSNIAEGYKRNNLPEYIHFCGIAAGSLSELETQVLLTKSLFDISVQDILESIDYTQRMLTSMLNKLRAKNATRNAQLDTL